MSTNEGYLFLILENNEHMQYFLVFTKYLKAIILI